MTLTVGQPAPSFTLPSSDGGTLAVDDLRGSIVVLYFYPRDNTPGCTIEAQDFRDALPELKSLGAVVLGVSKDSIASHCKFRDRYSLSFPLLSDPDGAVLTAYDAWGDKVLYGKPMTGIIRSTVIIGRDGRVLKTFPKVSVKGHADAVVAAIRELDGGAAPAPTQSTPAKKPAATAKGTPAKGTPIVAKAAAAKQPVAAAARKTAAAAAKQPAPPAKQPAPPAKKPAPPARKPAAAAKQPAAKKKPGRR